MRNFTFLLAFALFALPAVLYAQSRETVAVIGTGDMGDSVGPKLAKRGYRVIYGSRDPTRESVKSLVSRTGADASATTQQQAAQQAAIVVLVVPWPAMEQVAQNLGNLDGKIVIDVSTPTRQAADGYLESLVETSSAEMIQAWNPRAKVVKTLLAGSNVIDDPMTLGRRVTSFVAADDREAKEVVARIVAELGLQPLDAGPLRNAREIEAWARLWFVPVLQKRKQGFELAVLPSNYWYCNWQDDWYAPVGDSENLAKFPDSENPPEPCPSN
ncbi:MAG: NAD(P)-binding domain-containing protein [Gammaproteobacteria bacterium]|nr:NAD(P)-binding domain-containing protein [Gammaproteobacteria bacterium]